MTDQNPHDDQSDPDRGEDARKHTQKAAAKRACMDKLLFLLFDGTSAACSNFFSICAGYGVSPDEALGVDDITPLVILNDRLSRHAISMVEKTRPDPRMVAKLETAISEVFAEKIEATIDPEEAELLIRAFRAYGQTAYFASKKGFGLDEIAEQRQLLGLAKEIEAERLTMKLADAVGSHRSEQSVGRKQGTGRAQ